MLFNLHISKKSSTFAPAFASEVVRLTNSPCELKRLTLPPFSAANTSLVHIAGWIERTRDGEWRSPVAQRSGGPEVACSNHVSPTKWNPLGFHFCVDGILPRACSISSVSCSPPRRLSLARRREPPAGRHRSSSGQSTILPRPNPGIR